MMNGPQLLAEYRDNGSETAFAELVRKHTGLVYSTAKRRLRSDSLAEDVTQSVFVRLAKTVPRIGTDAELIGWLHRTTLHVAIDAWRSESRRLAREQHAFAMESLTNDHDASSPWEEVAPVLDEAIHRLPPEDRSAILMRFFSSSRMRDVGEALGISEDAAKMRISRALEKLRKQLASRGVICPAASLVGFLSERVIEAAPGHLVVQLGSIQWAVAAAAPATTTSVAAPLKLFSLKFKLAILVGAVITTGVGIGWFGARRASSDGSSSSGQNAVSETRSLTPDSAVWTAGGTAPSVAAAQPGWNPWIEDAKTELRTMLVHPPSRTRYAPPELLRVLDKFGDQIQEAMPILVEALNGADFEARLWAVSGISYVLNQWSRLPSYDSTDATVFHQTRSALARIIGSADEPESLRMTAFSAYLEAIANPAHRPSGEPLDSQLVSDLISGLQAAEPRLRGTRFVMAGQLKEFFRDHPEQVFPFVEEMKPMLSHSDSSERLIAAYALAIWPGGKPDQVREILMSELKGGNLYSHHILNAIGRLGASAVEIVPELLAYAGTAEDRVRALEAACRLQPELRSRFPEIDARLKREEQALASPRTSVRGEVMQVEQVAAALADPRQGPTLLQSMIASLHQHPDPESGRQSLLSFLRGAVGRVPEEQRSSLNAAIEAVRQADLNAVEAELEPRAPQLKELILEAQIILNASPNPNEARIEQLLKMYRDSDAAVTSDMYWELAESLARIDPSFQQALQKEILLRHPRLDRVLLSGRR